MINSRRKGKAGELEAAHFLSTLFGLPVNRGQQYSGLEAADVVGLPGIHVEVKRTERFNAYKAIEQAKNDAADGEVPLVLHRRNRQGWLAILAADDLIPLTAAILHLAKELNNGPVEAKGDKS